MRMYELTNELIYQLEDLAIMRFQFQQNVSMNELP
jgi:hypothetical protein